MKSKCKGLHNQRVWDRLGSVWLRSSLAERDLGVLVDSQLNMSQQCAAAPTMANWIQGCIHRSTTSRDRDMIIPLYLEVLLDKKLNMSQQCVLTAQKASCVLATSKEVWSAGQGRWFCPSTLVRPHL